MDISVLVYWKLVKNRNCQLESEIAVSSTGKNLQIADLNNLLTTNYLKIL